MKAHVENISDTKKKIRLEVPVDLVNQAYDQAKRNVGKKANIKGFRKGKVPDHVLNQFYGAEIDMEGLNILVQSTYEKAIKEHNLIPIIQPKFDIKPVEKGKDYTYEVELEVKPSFELKDYFGIKLKKKEAVVNDDEIGVELKRIQESRAELKPADGKSNLEVGLMATIDFEGTINGVAFEGGTSKGYVLEYGKGHFIKDLEDKMNGLGIGEERLIDVIFPTDYHSADLAGKPAQFKVKLIALHVKDLPVLDDEFAKDLGKETLAEVKKEIESMIVKRCEREFRHAYSDQVSEVLSTTHQFEVPAGLFENEKKHSTGKPEEDIKKSIRLQFVLESIAEKENIEVTPQDLETRLQMMARMYRQPVSDIKKYYHQNNMLPQLANQVLIEKTLDLLVDKATLE